jgi:hypothetical protein
VFRDRLDAIAAPTPLHKPDQDLAAGLSTAPTLGRVYATASGQGGCAFFIRPRRNSPPLGPSPTPCSRPTLGVVFLHSKEASQVLYGSPAHVDWRESGGLG